MHRLPVEPLYLYFKFSRHNEPRLLLKPGESMLVEFKDAFSSQIRTNQDRCDKTVKPHGNPQTGPMWIKGAPPSDTLAVKIESSIGQCATRTSDPKLLCEWLGDECSHGTHVGLIRDGKIYWLEKITLAYTLMLGCIGTALDTGVPTTGPVGPHGENMDIIETCPDNVVYVVYLPVFIEGIYLYLGDLHAAARGLEMPAHMIIR